MRDGRKPVTGAPIGLLIINPFSPNVTFLCPLETSENLGFSGVFGGYRYVTLGEYGLNRHFFWKNFKVVLLMLNSRSSIAIFI